MSSDLIPFSSVQAVYDAVTWERRDAQITDITGNVIFEQQNIEVPTTWSQTALNIVAQKYFSGALGTPERETSIRQLIDRVARTITEWGTARGYFDSTTNEADTFQIRLTYFLLNQYAAFNSPVWFNVGVRENPQCSACFINSIEDDMASILELAKTEGMLFKYGSGSGTNLSSLRGSQEKLKGGGQASGPVSFMKGFDAFAGVIKSGGKTRRAAKMVMLDVDHPDIEEFIHCKTKEEKKAHVLIDAGYDDAIDGEAYGSVFFQNSNNSVRVSDAFMDAVHRDIQWTTINRTDGTVAKTYRARNLFRQMAEAAHTCGDPGVQFDTTINNWHTCAATNRIYGSNPCSEYMFLDDSACNLASLNLMKFLDESDRFDTDKFCEAIRIMITAQEIIVGASSYPTPAITENSHKYRPLGLGYANLGALLMSRGLPYDSTIGRDYAADITSLMCATAYLVSAELARDHGPFDGYAHNRETMLEVISNHTKAAKYNDSLSIGKLAYDTWKTALELGGRYGFRNSQVTVLAPTGTIGFMMDCDTTGIEPDISLVKYKKLVGGGSIKIVNNTVPVALARLQYTQQQIADIQNYIADNDTIEGAPHLLVEDLPVFDCAFKAQNGTRTITPKGHVDMMAAVQPFLSGAISKTVNMPEESTVEDIEEIYEYAWKKGVKAVAVYRDGCKRSQPLSTGSNETDGSTETPTGPEVPTAVPLRRKLPSIRPAVTHKFSIGGHEGYITVGHYDNGDPGEVFITISKEGSTISGLMDSLAIAISVALQHGVPLEVLTEKFSHTRFEPSGFTGNKDVPIAKSIIDYLARWLALRYATPSTPTPDVSPVIPQPVNTSTDAPACSTCGHIMTRNGSCYKCGSCGETSGCS